MNPPNLTTTPQGQALTGLQSTLNQITGMAQQAPQDPTVGIENAVTSAGNTAQPAAVQNARSTLFNESGIPSLMNQQNNLGQIFQMYLADQGMAQQYSSPTLNSGTSPIYGNSSLNTQGSAIANQGTPNTFNDPYLSGPTAMVNAIMGQPNANGQYTFQGFNTPSENTSEANVVPTDATTLINSLTGMINSQQANVNTDVGNYTTGYNNIMNQLNTVLGQQSENAFGSGVNSVGSAQSAATDYATIQEDYISSLPAGTTPTPDGLYDYIQKEAPILKGEGIDLSEVYNLQGQIRNEIGGDGDLQSLSSKSPKKVSASDYSSTPNVSTAGGKETTTGWTAKVGNATLKITDPSSASNNIFSEGLNLITGNQSASLTNQAQPQFTVTEIMQQAKQRGFTAEQTIYALQQAGYKVSS